jgi:hypothetical protein
MDSGNTDGRQEYTQFVGFAFALRGERGTGRDVVWEVGSAPVGRGMADEVDIRVQHAGAIVSGLRLSAA